MGYLFVCFREFYVVNFEKEVEDFVCWFKVCILKFVKVVGGVDFFDFLGDLGVDVGESVGFFGGGDFFGGLLMECGDGFVVGCYMLVIINFGVVVVYGLENFYCFGVWVVGSGGGRIVFCVVMVVGKVVFEWNSFFERGVGVCCGFFVGVFIFGVWFGI